MARWRWNPVDLEKEAYEVVEKVMKEKEIKPHYLIGPDDLNGICLRMGDGYNFVTLSMTPDAVADLIHQLAAMIRKDYEVTVHRVDPEEKALKSNK